MEIIRNHGHDYLHTDVYAVVYFQGNKIAEGMGILDLGCYEEIQPVFMVNGRPFARRHLPETGVTNIRDLGGIKTTNGKQIKYHHFYRGAALLPKDELQKQFIDELTFHTILDLRSEQETINREDYVSQGTNYTRYSGVKMLDDPKNKGNFDFAYLVQSGNIHELKNYMLKMYESMPIENPAFHALMDDVKQQKTPLYFHCTAGKDRTGVSGALILLCLGVDEKDVYEEYLLSNVYRKEVNEWLLSRVEEEYKDAIRPLYEVSDAYLAKALNKIKEIYGSYDAYFEKEHHLTLEDRLALQEIYCD